LTSPWYFYYSQDMAKTMTATARKVAARFPVGSRVVATDGPSLNGQERRRGTSQGTVRRFIPMNNAQGGTVVVEWDTGIVSRCSAGSLDSA
jgi:hypothetical protein